MVVVGGSHAFFVIGDFVTLVDNTAIGGDYGYIFAYSSNNTLIGNSDTNCNYSFTLYGPYHAQIGNTADSC